MSMTINAISQGDYRPYPSNIKTRQISENTASEFLLNQASSGVSELAIYEKMTAQMQGLGQGIANTANMNNLITTAEAGLSAIPDSLQRIRELSLAASNGILTDEDRAIYQGEVNQMLSTINNIANYTEFNGMKLLNGTFVDRNTASTPNGTGRRISIGDMSLGGLSLTGYNVTGRLNLGVIDNAINTVTGARASLGAISNTFGHTMNANAVAQMNLAAARSRFVDTNIAKASTLHGRNRIIAQYKLLAQRQNMALAKNIVTEI